MKTWQLEKLGRANLHLVETPKPEPGPSEILVRSKAISLNFRDKAIIEGSYVIPIDFPLVPGSDLAGEVVSVGANVTRFKAGDQVVSTFQPLWLDGIPTVEARNATLGGPLPGVLAEYVLLPDTGALAYPEYLTPAQASTLPIAAVTAWVALFKHGNLQPSETVLIHGSGGVSLFGLQLARALGARVIATSRSATKIHLLKQLGASDVIDTTKYPAWDEEARSLTQDCGVDHVLEVVGGEYLQRSIAALALGGHVAVIGFMESMTSTISLPPLMLGNLKLQGVGVGSRKDMVELLNFLEHHRVEPVIDASYDFSDLPDALDHLDRGPFGKVVVEIR
ncbi:zinc-dependent alcohol dehydrogenase family protein [Granulicella tundricola]|uniref:Alcohol dehydrogenase zinc-binding domain protein n=1 Tax=Granulicella tundricola (strain ATCC BAA-1859 / DSM 23138 / MP5ACTX9) TaxID=1198114 RepID=E8WWB2_GRATM|nr:NAD(P)-dependent alcohol dehydrogenase [Granulicella tundricola]ADW68495.1 Alcohol dehydrogenase zinc-binding domain protein [Granulicella tundricola MP5ACTX9]